MQLIANYNVECLSLLTPYVFGVDSILVLRLQWLVLHQNILISIQPY